MCLATRDQVRLLCRNIVVTEGALTLADLGIAGDRGRGHPAELSGPPPPARPFRLNPTGVVRVPLALEKPQVIQSSSAAPSSSDYGARDGAA